MYYVPNRVEHDLNFTVSTELHTVETSTSSYRVIIHIYPVSTIYIPVSILYTVYQWTKISSHFSLTNTFLTFFMQVIVSMKIIE